MLRCVLIRVQALAAVKPLGPVTAMTDDLKICLSEVWDCWVTDLQQQPLDGQQQQQQLSYAAKHQRLVEQGQLQQWPRPCVWSAMKVVLGMLQVRAVPGSTVPDACTAAAATGPAAATAALAAARPPETCSGS